MGRTQIAHAAMIGWVSRPGEVFSSSGQGFYLYTRAAHFESISTVTPQIQYRRFHILEPLGLASSKDPSLF